MFPFCRLRLRKRYAELLRSRKSQLEPASDLDGDFPQSEVTLVAVHATHQTRFKSLLQRSMSVLRQQRDKPAPDQGVELMGVAPTRYNECKDSSTKPDHYNSAYAHHLLEHDM